jgi:hypothetical protein
MIKFHVYSYRVFSTQVQKVSIEGETLHQQMGRTDEAVHSGITSLKLLSFLDIR